MHNSDQTNQTNQPDQNKRSLLLRYAKPGIALLSLLAYTLFVTGDYFLPVKSSVWLLGVTGLLGLLVVVRLYFVYRPTRQNVAGWLKTGWPVLALLIAVAGGVVLRWQAIKSAALTTAEQDFAGQALAILTRSDWKPKSFEQPPLYLYLAALLGEVQFVQQAGAGKLTSPDGLLAADLALALRYINLLLGLLTFIPVYATARQLWSAKAGVVAAGLLATSWLAYHATASLLPATLAGLLAATALFFSVWAYRTERVADFGWAGLLSGLALAAAYGAVWLILPAGLAVLWQRQAKFRKATLFLGGLLSGFTLAAPGWILSFNLFAGGLAAIGRAPETATAFYLKQTLANDLGLFLIFLLTLGVSMARRELVEENRKIWLILIFPLAYVLTVAFFGPPLLERLAPIVPVIAVASTQPILLAAKFVQRKLDEHDDRHKWGESSVLIALVVVLALLSVLARRFFL